MDHVENAISQFFGVYLDEFMSYHKSGEYKRLSDNPVYEDLKAIIDAMNCIRKRLDWENIRLSEEVKNYSYR